MSPYIFQIAICDDDLTDRTDIEKNTQEICEEEQIYAKLFSYENSLDLLNDLKNGKKFDILLLDVCMPEVTGMEVAKYLRENNLNTSIIFISVNLEMALQGYLVSASRYLIKPVKKEELREAILFCHEQSTAMKYLLLPVENYMRKISLQDIYYIEIHGRKSRIVTPNNIWDTRRSMTELESQLIGQGFIRCHKSYLVNSLHICAFGSTFLELTDGKQIPVSKHRLKEARELFFSYMNR